MGKPPNCTLVELKCGVVAGRMNAIVISKLYLSGIEIETLTEDTRGVLRSKLYLSGIEILAAGNRKRRAYLQIVP